LIAESDLNHGISLDIFAAFVTPFNRSVWSDRLLLFDLWLGALVDRIVEISTRATEV